MNILDDPQFVAFFKDRKNIHGKRKRTYKIVFEQYQEVVGLTPTQMIKEAKKQQEPDWDNRKYIDIDKRKITKYLKKFYNYLEKEKNNKESSIKVKIGIVRTFYEQFNIDLPKNVIFENNYIRTRKTDIPNWDDVEEVVEKLEDKKHIALVYFFVTSGIRSGDVCNLTIGDFLEATKKYHNGTLEDLLSKDPYEHSIRPAWDFDPEKTDYKGNICLTSNTPQAMKALFSYLNKRIMDGEPRERKDPLFRSSHKREKNVDKSHFYDSDTMGELFKKKINIIFNTKDDEGNILVRKDKFGYTFFRPHNLRKLFKTTCSTHLPKAMFEVEERANISKDLDILNLLTAHTPLNANITKAYEAVEHSDIDPYYFQLIPYLTIGEIKAKDAHSDEFKELKDEIKELKEEKNSDLEWISNLRKKYGDSKFQEMLEKED